MTLTWRERLAREAGFFDGEGHTGASPIQGTTRPRLAIGISQNDRRVLDRFRDVVGIGKVYGPYHTTNTLYYYQVEGFQRVQAIIAMLWDFLGPLKREQAAAALLKLRIIPSYRHVCRRGHPRTPENTYQRGGKPTCRLCNIDQNRAFRERHPAYGRAYHNTAAHRQYMRNYRWAKKLNAAAAKLPWLETA